MAALPYMPLFVADYLADTAHLTPAQHGAYLLLIMNYWQRGGPLPNDDARLARIARMNRRDWAHNRDDILEFFTVQDSLLYHSRIDSELSRVEAKSLKCKDAAKASVQRRFGERSTSVEPTDTQAHTEEEKPKPNGLVKNRPDKGFRLPSEWQPQPLIGKAAEMVACWQPGQLERELAKFKNYWWSKGANASRTDWQRTWVNWLISADERKPQHHERPDNPTTIAVQRVLGAIQAHN